MKLRYALLFAAVFPLAAHAWWNETWTERRVVVLDTSAAGVETASAVSGAALPVRLHSGNFDFLAAKQDGSDLRFMAADDKTPLKFHIERFDGTNELAVAWVQVPQIAPKTAGQKIYAYFGNAEAPAESNLPAASYDSATNAVFHFREGEASPLDSSSYANNATTHLSIEKAGLLGASAKFEGMPLALAASPSLKLSAGGAFSFSAWLRFTDPPQKAVLYRQGPVAISVDGGKVNLAGAGPQAVTGGALAPNAWQHVAVTVGAGQAVLYVNGAQVASGAAGLPEVQDAVKIGEGLAGMMDEVQIASTVRSADWVKLAASAQGAESKLLTVNKNEEAASSGGGSYFGILVGNLTTDAWAVIIILLVMFVVAVAVMIAKARMISVTDKDNRSFLQRFRHAAHDFLDLETGAAHPHSSLFRLYQAGIREVKKRANAQGEVVNLSGASIDAIKAAVDADMVRETHKLNAKMVLLTIAISGGPFLGLLGTVVGVMITFAAIAAAGDVNVNAIAPGIAAALLATVAGLAVAIPALFGYNYLASRIKNISADMQIFVDEFITRIAEVYSR
jgi:biopolymer transport protein ExbB